MTAKELFLAFYQICSGLDCLHAASVVHQDLHLGNALFSENGQVCKLSDAGNAELIDFEDRDNVLQQEECW